MKTKIMIALTSVFVIAALAALMIFVFSGDLGTQPDNAPNLTGTWKVIVQVAENIPVHINDEFYVFTADSAANYRDGGAEPYAISSYTVTPGKYPNYNLEFKDLGRTMALAACTDNLIRLYSGTSQYIELYRYPNEDRSLVDLDASILEGSWNVTYRRTDDAGLNEQMVFEAGVLRDYRNGSETPALIAGYEINAEGRLCVASAGMETYVYPCTSELVFLVEVDTGYVWELHRMN